MGSAIYISQSVSISSGVIESIKVSNNYNSRGAPITIRHIQGTLNIYDSSFLSNSGRICAIYSIFETEGKLLTLNKITASNNDCSNSVIRIESVFLQPIITADQLEIMDNKCIGLQIYNVIIYHSNSSYIGNQGGIYISRISSVELTSVKFIRNETKGTTGGVYISNGSFLICKYCEFRENKGLQVGAIFSEQFSKQ
jgi:hypothetical protein